MIEKPTGQDHRVKFIFSAGILLCTLLPTLGCDGEVTPPYLDPPGERTEYLTNYDSVHLAGNLNSDYQWPVDWTDAAWEATRMSLVADSTWEKTILIEYADGEFKFAVNSNWTLSFGPGDSWGSTA